MRLFMSRYLKKFKKSLIISITLIVLVSFLVAISPFIEGKIIDHLQNSINNNKAIDLTYVLKIVLIMFSIYLLVAIGRFTFNSLLTKAIQKAISNLRIDVQRKIHKLPIKYFDTNLVGNTMGIMDGDIDTLSTGIQQTFSNLFSSITLMIFVTIIMFLVNVKLALITIIMVPVAFILAYILVKKSQGLFVERYDAYNVFTGFLQEKYTGYKDLLLYNQQKRLLKEFKKHNEKSLDLIYKSNFISGLLLPMVNSLIYILVAIIIVVAGKMTLNGIITLGVFQAFTRYVWRLGNPISQLTQMSAIMQATDAAARRVFDFLREDEEINDIKDTKELIKSAREIEFKNVTFGYNKEKLILKNVSFKIKPGDMVAIVGKTGSGKTTIINLLMRFYDVNEGDILIDDVSIYKMKKDYLRSLFGMVLQDTWLFNGTISENIKYSKDAATKEEIEFAAKEASVDHYIKTTPFGYETMINQEADNISGGEKQLLTIARAILKKPDIMILDEATSTVDTRVELLLQEAMKKVLKNRTSFIIAHRLSTIKNADIILVLNDGVLMEQGNHDKLISEKGIYYKLYQSQFQDS